MTALPISFNDEFFVLRNGRPIASGTAATIVSVLDTLGLVSPAAHDMPLSDVLTQVNEVNGGEIVVERISM